ncbi:mitochondrial fission factor-like [Synchiropus picturatus]
MSHIPHHDPAFTEAISKNMQVPERLSVSPAPQWPEDDPSSLRAPEELLPAFTMQVPDKLTYSETSDMSPRPLFTPPRQALCSPSSLDPCWESLSADVLHKDLPQSPIKRSYSDQSFSRTPPGTPTHVKQMLQRHPAMLPSPGSDHQRSTFSHSTQPPLTQVPAPHPASPSVLLTSLSMLQTARQLSLQLSQRLLHTVDKYRHGREEMRPPGRAVTPAAAPSNHQSCKNRTVENWSTEEDGGTAVELIVLRRQLIKISRRLAALERNNHERRNTEVLLFSLLFSACLLNVWLWIRR